MDKCAYCSSQKATYQCQKCDEYYCSATCQNMDWPNHKYLCQKMPALVNINKDNAFVPLRLPRENKWVQSSYANISKSEIVSVTAKYGFQRSCGTYDDDVVHKGCSTPDKNDTQNQNQLPRLFSQTCEISNSLTKVSDQRIAYEKNVNEVKQRKQSENEKILDCMSTNSTTASINREMRSKENWKNLYSLKTDFFSAIVRYYDSKNKIAWVSDDSWKLKFDNLLNQINSNEIKLIPADSDDLKIGQLVVVPYDNIFYRAVVLDLKSLDELEVQLLDIGQNFCIKNQDVKKAPNSIKVQPKMVFAIKYNDNVEIGQNICIRISNKQSDNVYNVQRRYIYKNTMSSKNLEYTLIDKSILTNLKNSFQIIIFHKLYPNTEKALALIIDHMLQKDLSHITEILNANNEFYDIHDEEIPTGSFVAAKYAEDFWRRGLYLGSYQKEFLILFIDDGKIKIVNQIKYLPEKFAKICNLTVCIEFKNFENERVIKEQTIYNCKIKALIDENYNLQCEMYDSTNKVGEAILKPFDGNYSDFIGSNFYIYPFINGDLVQITKVMDYKSVQLSLSYLVQYYNRIFSEIGKETGIPEKFLKEDDVILVKIDETERYIRCKLLSYKSSNRVECLHLESGDIIEANINAIKEASDFVKNCPTIILNAKLHLLNLGNLDIVNNKGLAFLQKACKEKKDFSLIWRSEFVELYSDLKVSPSLNQQILTLIFQKHDKSVERNQKENIDVDNSIRNVIKKPNSHDVLEKELNSETISPKKFYLKDINHIPLTTGDNIPLLILDNSRITEGIFTASVVNREFYCNLIKSHQEKINKYCNEESTEEEYSPQVNELILTLNKEDKIWYRAYCLAIEKNNTFKLKLLDFGNEQLIEPKYIRKMTENFLFECYANTCHLAGSSKDFAVQQVETLSVNSIIIAIVVEGEDKQYFVHEINKI